MYRAFSAINNINNNIGLVVDPTSQPLFTTELVEIEDIEKYGEAEAGNFIVEDDEGAALALSRLLGQPEPELYQDEKNPTTWVPDQDKLAQLVELQLRMERGMEMIQEQTIVRDTLRTEYYTLKARVQKGLELLEEFTSSGRSYKDWVHQRHQARLNKEKNEVGAALGQTNDRLSVLWDHWKKLKDECGQIVGKEKALWAAYFEIEDKGQWYEDYLNSDIWFDCIEIDTVEEIHPPVMVQNDKLALSREKWCVTSKKRINSL